MISEEKRLLTRLEHCVRVDPKDPTVFHVDFDNAVRTLGQFEYLIPPAQFEAALSELFDKALINKLRAHPQVSRFLIATAILDTANAIDMRKDELLGKYKKMKVQDIVGHNGGKVKIDEFKLEID